MYKELKHTCTAILVLWRSRCPRRRGLLKIPNIARHRVQNQGLEPASH